MRKRSPRSPALSKQAEFTFSLRIEGRAPSVPTTHVRLRPAVPSEVYDTFWRFAAERQEIFFRRLHGTPEPWSEDPILRHYKFTNAYRASDRVSQYLIRHVIYDGDSDPDEVFFRTILFKLFNRISTWRYLRTGLGEIRWREYSFDRYDRLLSALHASGHRIYSGAYIMPPGGTFGHRRKHRNHLRLLELMMKDRLAFRIAESRSMAAAFRLLRSYPSLGDFLAYQFAIDINYSNLTNFSEMDFVVPGPGARDGIRKCFKGLGGFTETEIIRLVADCQAEEFGRLGVTFHSLWGRPLQLIDCQNLFCEVDKYARLAHPTVAGRSGRTHIKRVYRPDATPIIYWYPPKWGLKACQEPALTTPRHA